MLIERKLITTSGRYLDIASDDPVIHRHFTDAHNFTDVIIDQINNQDIYGRWLKNKTDLNILDCGGNVGLFALHVSDCAKKVVTVEPTPAHLSILRTLTAPYPNITVVEGALCSEDSKVPFYFYPTNTTMNSIANNYGAGEIIVEGKTLKTIMDENGMDVVDFAKIDIEGSELFALTADTIGAVEKRIKTWFIETHGSAGISYIANRDHLCELFRAAGYGTVELVSHDTILVMV